MTIKINYMKYIASKCGRTLISVTMCISASACTSLQYSNYPQDLAAHVLPIDPDGYPSSIASTIDDQDVSVRIPYAETAPLNEIFYALDEEIAEAKASGRDAKHILLYIHGGLNAPRESLERAAMLISRSDGLSPDYFPIFINWQSDFGSTYFDHLTKNWQGEEGNWMWVWFIKAPVYFATDLAKAVVGAPKSWLLQAIHLGQSWLNSREAKQPEPNDSGSVTVSAPKPEFDYQCKSDQKIAGVLPELARLVTTPVVVELGRPAWNMMLRRTRTLFWTSDALAMRPSSDEKYAYKRNNNDCQGCGGLNLLLKYLEDRQQTDSFRITLIGHSMGGIVANRVVAEAPTLRFDNIVHMASADSVDDTFALTFNYMRSRAGKATQYYSLMLQWENENWEVSGGGIVPSGSLLAWIDNMFTDPPTSRSRRAGRWSNMERFVSQIPEDISRRVHFTVFSGNAEGQPLKHADFGNCRFWNEAFWNGTNPAPAH